MKAKEVAKAINEIKLALIAVPILAMIMSAFISSFVLAPVYQSSTTLMVFKKPEVAAPYEARVATITLNQRLVKTYSELANSSLIIEEIIKQNKLKMSVEDLRKKIKVGQGDTEFLKITVEDSNPTMAAKLANEMARILMEKVAEIMNFDNLQVVDAAIPPAKPIWPNYILNVLFAGVIGLILVLGIAIFRASLKDNSEETGREPQIILHPISSNQAIIYTSKDEQEIHKNNEQNINT